MGISRRTVLAATAAMPFVPGLARAAGAVSIRLDPQRRLRAMPAGFMGLGYEISSVAVPGLLSADNRAYVQLVRNLGRQGVIRVGGNTSDFSSYQADGVSQSLPKGTVVTAENFRQLRGFLDAIGWKLIWGLNLGGDRLDNAVEEAKAIANAMGDRLLALEIGNEPDLFPNAGHRTPPYGYAAWHDEYRRYKAAIRAVLPAARVLRSAPGPHRPRRRSRVEPVSGSSGPDGRQCRISRSTAARHRENPRRAARPPRRCH